MARKTIVTKKLLLDNISTNGLDHKVCLCNAEFVVFILIAN